MKRPSMVQSFSALNTLADVVISNSPASSQEESHSPTKEPRVSSSPIVGARRKLFQTPSPFHTPQTCYLGGKVSPRHVAVTSAGVAELHFVVTLNEMISAKCSIARFVLKSDQVFPIGRSVSFYSWHVTSSTEVREGIEWQCVACLGEDTPTILTWVEQNRLVLVSAVMVMDDDDEPLKAEVQPHRMQLQGLPLSC
jgi:hypothetical protein